MDDEQGIAQDERGRATTARRSQAHELTVADVMTHDMLTCAPETPVAEAARRMSAARCSSILIRDGDRLVGIWTEHDALKADFEQAATNTRAIREAMTAPVLTIPAETSMREAAASFKEQQIRHFVVVDGHAHPIGLISQSDVVLNHGVEWFMRMQRISSVLTQPPPLLPADASLTAATERMRHDRHDAVAIETDADDYAILTERDILRHVAHGGANSACIELATRPMETVRDSDSLFHARNTMLSGSFRHLGVINAKDALVGLIGFGDIMQTIEHGYVEELESALRERELELRQSEERYRALVEASPDAICVHRDGYLLFINPAGARLLGARAPEQILNEPLERFLEDCPEQSTPNRVAVFEHELCSHPLEERFTRLDGHTIDVELRIMPITYNGDPAWQVVMSDISRRKEIEAELHHRASIDQLTGIFNRPYFEQRLDQALRESIRFEQPLALIMFDLNGFKRVNDTYGHDAGDEALTQVARTIAGKLRDTDVFARWGGDEFMLLCPRTGTDGAYRLCCKLAEALRETDCSPLGPVGAAFAIGQYSPSEDRRTLLKRLDLGVYQAKEQIEDGINGIARV